MVDFNNAIEFVSDTFDDIGVVADVVGQMVQEIPYLGFALGLSCFLGITGWLIKLSVHR